LHYFLFSSHNWLQACLNGTPLGDLV
jgi:hypothetical protein